MAIPGQDKDRLRDHYESRAALPFGGPEARFGPEQTILAIDVGTALIETHFDRAPLGLDEIFATVGSLIDDLAPVEEPERTVPMLSNILGALLGNGLLRPGISGEWYEDASTGGVRLRIRKGNGATVELDPIGTVRDAFLSGARGRLQQFHDSVVASL